MIRGSMIVLVTGFLIAIGGLLPQRSSSQDNAFFNPVSLIRVIANPKDFDHKRIRTIGYLYYNALDRRLGIYVSEVDGRNWVAENSVDTNLDERKVGGLIRNYVLFSGVYHAPDPRSGDNGSFDQILDLKPWKPGEPK